MDVGDWDFASLSWAMVSCYITGQLHQSKRLIMFRIHRQLQAWNKSCLYTTHMVSFIDLIIMWPSMYLCWYTFRRAHTNALWVSLDVLAES